MLGTVEVGGCAGGGWRQRPVAERLAGLEEEHRLRGCVWAERLATKDVGAAEAHQVCALSAPQVGEETSVVGGVQLLRSSVSHMHGQAAI